MSGAMTFTLPPLLQESAGIVAASARPLSPAGHDVPNKVGRCKGVPFGAMRPSRANIAGIARRQLNGVLAMRHWLQVRWIHAFLASAYVVQIHPLWNGTDRKYPHSAISEAGWRAPHADPSISCGLAPCPKPAAGCVVNDSLRPDVGDYVSHASWHRGKYNASSINTQSWAGNIAETLGAA